MKFIGEYDLRFTEITILDDQYLNSCANLKKIYTIVLRFQ